jgi:uncharacterized OB-fold protein
LSVQFWRTKDRYYRILGNKCESCGQEYFPPVTVCPNCHSTKLIDREMPKSGSLLSYSLQKESVQGFEDQEPMIFGLIRLENGVRIISQLVDIPYESLKEGMKLVAVFRRIKAEGEAGQIFYGYKFSRNRTSKFEGTPT